MAGGRVSVSRAAHTSSGTSTRTRYRFHGSAAPSPKCARVREGPRTRTVEGPSQPGRRTRKGTSRGPYEDCQPLACTEQKKGLQPNSSPGADLRSVRFPLFHSLPHFEAPKRQRRRS
jgi:hypothetical protein